MIQDKRICKTCSRLKKPEEFYNDSRYPNGDIHCAECRRKKVKAWRDANPARAKEIGKKSRIRNSEAARKRSNEWHKKNHARHLAYMAERRKTHALQILSSKLQSAFGITLEEYNAFFSNQKGACAICQKHPQQNKKRLAVDHCHKTQKVRGLLCSTCNQAIGLFKDDVSLLQSAILYLTKTPKT
jgi:hypothetical protein